MAEIDILLSEERSQRAASFIKRLSDSKELRYVLDSLNDTKRNLIRKASEDNKSERDETISQLCYLTDVYDALAYIAGDNRYREEDRPC